MNEKIWTEEDLQRLVNDEAIETSRLEFKSCGAITKAPRAKEEIARDVSAMANGAGGTIILGIVEKNHIAEKVDIGFDEGTISKEFLDQVLSSNIQPRIEGLKIHRVALTSRNVAYVLEIPQATGRAPHQSTADGRYYKRSNTTRHWMEDYEVRDILRRAIWPDLFVLFRLKTSELIFQDGNELSEPIQLIPSIGNRSSEPAYYSSLQLYFAEDVGVSASVTNYRTKRRDARLDDIWFTALHKMLTIPSFFPIIKETVFDLEPIALTFKKPTQQLTRYRMAYDVKAPGCHRQEAQELVLEGGSVRIEIQP